MECYGWVKVSIMLKRLNLDSLIGVVMGCLREVLEGEVLN